MTKSSLPSPETTEPVPGTFRSVFKWGKPDEHKAPSPGFLKVILQSFQRADNHFQGNDHFRGDRLIPEIRQRRISPGDLAALKAIVGEENVSIDAESRLRYSTGKSMEEILKLRHGIVDSVSDAAVHPRSRQDIIAVMDYCSRHRIPLHVYGGGSSVTSGLSCRFGGITLVMATHMNRVIAFNEVNQTITVEPGMMGPVYEAMLNEAPRHFGAAHSYTGGHFPQSFEHSSVGGWVAALGSGQASSYYGDACDLVISQDIVTPVGCIKTHEYPSTATGPKVNDILLGSEGCFGVLVGVTLKVFRYNPGNARRFSFMFPDFESAVETARCISQGEFGMPSILRVSDPEETDVAMKMYGFSGTLFDRFLCLRGLVPDKRCLVMGQADGEMRFARNVARTVGKVSRRNGAMRLGAIPMKKWAHGRYSDAYLRDSLNDAGILIDTLETAVTWEKLHGVHDAVRSFIKQRAGTICMTHASHFYSQGTNLYFIFITPMMMPDDFSEFQCGIIKRILASGGSLSHHHGVGRVMGGFMERHLGVEQMAVLKTLKRHFDPEGILNPGGTLGLDMAAEKKHPEAFGTLHDDGMLKSKADDR